MFGFFIGAVSVAGLAMLAWRGRGYRHGMHRRFRRRGLYYVLERLDTTPGQEKVIVSAVDAFAERARSAAKDARASRKAVAEAVRAEHFDTRAFAALFDGHLESLTVLRDELAKTALSIHDALNESQRERLADLVESGPRLGYGPHAGYGRC